MIFNEMFTLQNGVNMPKFALGTWLIEDSIVSDTVQNALQIGYRHIDTAQAYENERGVGEAIRLSGIPREEIFITSKVVAETKSFQEAEASIDESLRKSGLDYLDLMLIHCPQPWAEYPDSPNRYLTENIQVWKALEKAYQSGKVRAIGVSNFLQSDIENLLSACKIKPMVNQIRVNVTHTPLDLIAYCQEQNIIVEAYSPIAHGDALNLSVLGSLAQKYGITVPQLCIQYDLQLGLGVLPKTTHPEYMLSNAQLDFTISDEDMLMLKHLTLVEEIN